MEGHHGQEEAGIHNAEAQDVHDGRETYNTIVDHHAAGHPVLAVQGEGHASARNKCDEHNEERHPGPAPDQDHRAAGHTVLAVKGEGHAPARNKCDEHD